MLYRFIDHMPRVAKQLIVLSVDATLVVITLYAAFALRFGDWLPWVLVNESWKLLPIIAMFSGAVSIILRIPRIKLSSFGEHTIPVMGVFAGSLALATIVVTYVLGLSAPRSVPLIFGVLFFAGTVAVRLMGVRFLHHLASRRNPRVPVAIYGAGAAGIQLASALRETHQVEPVIFVDDNADLHGIIVAGLKVRPPSKLQQLANTGRISRVILAIPSAPRARQQELLAQLAELSCDVQVLPSFVDLLAGKDVTDSLRPVTPDELLGREKVNLDTPEVAKAYAGRSVMVTGAGGSIGAELCRQLLNCNPRHIVLFERSEFALYEIDMALRPLAAAAGITMTTRLGSVTDRPRVEEVIDEEAVEIILHAAAYKHVPLVEDNVLEGARNNVLGTQIVADVARSRGLERFILISTDKAVRPTNIMGATKRLAERVIQEMQVRANGTRFAMVRFGNVLGSSGSVVPLFQQQIRLGGPITVTHPDVTRYFMTIPEAARLVLLAGAYSAGGDVFVLDMGSPVKIVDLARRMVSLSGRRIRDADNPDGDIEIDFTGLRPGEKLFEELLVDDGSLASTPHEKILRAEEVPLSEIQTAGIVRELNRALESRDREAVQALIERWADGYQVPQHTARSSG